MPGGIVAPRRAVVSVSDRTGLVDLAKALDGRGVEIVSTGGTAAHLREAGLDPLEVSGITGFPEMLGGRVKTLHPMIHGGILGGGPGARDSGEMAEHSIAPIDLVVVNLYPFESAAESGAGDSEMIEQIDIGGPAMLRSAAKNHARVAAVSDPSLYGELLGELAANGGGTTLDFRRRMAGIAFARTAQYDSTIGRWMAGRFGDGFPERELISGALDRGLRYGENPGQRAALYRTGNLRFGVAGAEQLHGKELSYNNICDADAALGLVSEFPAPGGFACVIVKHGNPCGVAVADGLADAFSRAYSCDSLSAYGGIVAFNSPVDGETASLLSGRFLEVVVAPGFSESALEVLSGRGALRLLKVDGSLGAMGTGLEWRQVSGGFLVQDRDSLCLDEGRLEVVTKRAPDSSEMTDLRFAFAVAKHAKSNAIVFAKGRRALGIGAGQMSRVDSVSIALAKARDPGRCDSPGDLEGCAAASDAFFPFPDALERIASSGARSVIQPGGSVRDSEIIARADEAGLAMVFTGVRHFRH